MLSCFNLASPVGVVVRINYIGPADPEFDTIAILDWGVHKTRKCLINHLPTEMCRGRATNEAGRFQTRECKAKKLKQKSDCRYDGIQSLDQSMPRRHVTYEIPRERQVGQCTVLLSISSTVRACQ